MTGPRFIVFGFSHGRGLQHKEEKDCSDCHQYKAQKLAAVRVSACVCARGIGNLHIREGNINAERYIQILEEHMLPSFFSRDVPV